MSRTRRRPVANPLQTHRKEVSAICTMRQICDIRPFPDLIVRNKTDQNSHERRETFARMSHDCRETLAQIYHDCRKTVTRMSHDCRTLVRQSQECLRTVVRVSSILLNICYNFKVQFDRNVKFGKKSLLCRRPLAPTSREIVASLGDTSFKLNMKDPTLDHLRFNCLVSNCELPHLFLMPAELFFFF